MRKAGRGVTLVETLVGLALFGVLLFVLAEAVRYGLRAHTKGEAARQAQAVARRILDQLTSEIATGVVLETLLPETLSSNPRPLDFVSAVVWPEPYDPALGNPPDFTPAGVYPWSRPTENGVELNRAVNRLIMTRPGVGVSAQNFDQRDYSQFAYVEYVVPPPDAAGNGRHQLLRRVYRASATFSGPPLGNEPTPPGYRHIKPDFFKIDPYSRTSPGALYTNPNTTLHALPAAQQAAQMVVAALPTDEDRISFTVESTKNRLLEGVPSNRTGRFAYFEPSLFSITVTVSIGQTNPGQFLAVRSLSGQARVKSGQ